MILRAQPDAPALKRSAMRISAIVPTIGRPQSLDRLLTSLAAQTLPVDEAIVADASDGPDVAGVAERGRWATRGLSVRVIAVHPPNAARQREAAIAATDADLLLLLDDDVELEPTCVAELARALIERPDAVAAMADFNNQSWPQPTRVWRAWLRANGVRDGAWQGRILGPLLRFGFDPLPSGVREIEWIGAGDALVRREAFMRAGGFSTFFFDRATTHEDVDLSLRLARIGPLLFCPSARMAHHHAPEGRLTPFAASEDDVANRYAIMRETQGLTAWRAFGSAALYWSLESASALAGSLLRARGVGAAMARAAGGLRALLRIAARADRRADVAALDREAAR